MNLSAYGGVVKELFAITAIVLSIGIVAQSARADLDATVKFHAEIKSYFDHLLGPNSIDASKYTGEIPDDIQLRSRPYSIGEIVHPVGYIRLKNDTICRVGIGYSHPHRISFDGPPWPAVYAECAPITPKVAALEDDLVAKFNFAKEEVLNRAIPSADLMEKISEHISKDSFESFSASRRRTTLASVYLKLYQDNRKTVAEPVFHAYTTMDFKVQGSQLSVKPPVEFSEDFFLWKMTVTSCAETLVKDKTAEAGGDWYQTPAQGFFEMLFTSFHL